MSEAANAGTSEARAEERLLPFGLAFAGLGLIGIAMFLPYVDEGSVGGFTRIAENTLLQGGDGWITLIFAGGCVISLVRALQRPPHRIYWPLISGLGVIGFALYLGLNEEQRTLCPLDATTITDACSVASPGIGIYVLGLGGAALLAAGWFFLRLPKAESKLTAPDPMTVTRECPHCKTQIRPDASVCPHCQRESTPWVLHKDNKWWRQEADGTWFFYEQRQPDVGWHRFEPKAEATPKS